MLYADDAGIISKSAEGLAKVISLIVTVFEVAGLTVSENNKETMLLRTPDQTSLAPPLVIKAAGKRYRQTTQFLRPGGIIHESVTSRSKSNDGPVSYGHASKGSARSCNILRPPRLV